MSHLGFTFPNNSDVNYTVTYDENQGSMQVMYDITNIFLDAVISGNLFPEGFLSTERFPDLNSVSSNFVNEIIENANDIVLNNIPLVICIAVGILFALGSFIVGIVFCCCCRKSGKNTNGSSFKTFMTSVVLFFLLIASDI